MSGHHGQHISDANEVCAYVREHAASDAICEECLDFKQAWTHAGARRAEIEDICTDLRKRAGAAFARGDDERAKSYRALAEVYEQERLKPATLELNQYIEASRG